MNKIIFAVIALVILGGGYFLLKGGYQNPKSSAGQNTSQVSQSPANTIAAQNFAFNPQVLNVAAGTKVTWTNQDSTLHDVTSLTEGAFKSDTLNQNQSFSFTFDKVGEYDYQCSIHPSMTGKIIVQ